MKQVNWSQRNSMRLGRVMVAVVCVMGVPTYQSFVIIAVAAGFMALIIRIIKNMFEQAILMKDELNFTV